MTTTLRPLEPERICPGGRRERRYSVCVNSRYVGEILLGAEPPVGRDAETPAARTPLVGTISRLRIDERDRRRGRGTVAALAAEEVLRQWNCDRVEAIVPGGSEAGEQLATSLGYVERSRQLVKRVPDAASPLPDGCAARAMGETDFPAWREHERDGYTRTWTELGLAPSDARARAEASFHTYLPDGAATEGAVLRVLSCAGQDVGSLWVGLRGPVDPAMAWVFTVEVGEKYRGRGFGRALMLLAEAECVAAGVERLGLNVFVQNAAAVSLYASLGYVAECRYFVKPLL